MVKYTKKKKYIGSGPMGPVTSNKVFIPTPVNKTPRPAPTNKPPPANRPPPVNKSLPAPANKVQPRPPPVPINKVQPRPPPVNKPPPPVNRAPPPAPINRAPSPVNRTFAPPPSSIFDNPNITRLVDMSKRPLSQMTTREQELITQLPTPSKCLQHDKV